jgi:hypothetical protein
MSRPSFLDRHPLALLALILVAWSVMGVLESFGY